jgi:hypothetical protein
MMAESIDTATWLFMVDDVGTGTRYVYVSSYRVCVFINGGSTVEAVGSCF